MTRPEKNEYAEFYAGYVALVDETDVVSALQNQAAEMSKLLADLSAEKQDYRYAEGKWSVRELLGHMIDGERVFAYRALRISRGDQTPLASFDENEFVANSNFNQTAFSDLIEEFSALRAANALMFRNLSEEAWQKTGTASGATVSVRALAFIMVGHVRHHLNILQARYLA